jgi:hypothetical protein
VFPGDNVYTVQPSGWMDGEAFQEWVQRVVRPFAELHNNSLYLLLDQFSVHIVNALVLPHMAYFIIVNSSKT